MFLPVVGRKRLTLLDPERGYHSEEEAVTRLDRLWLKDVRKISPILKTDRLCRGPLLTTDVYKRCFPRITTPVPSVELVFAQRFLSGFSVRREPACREPK